ncbi:hypothetical protein AVEN_6044-1 [Araneus ventricosus]|uniref:Uncharacterized protein n=1 Tax=Araneus ventricosus TaxID=182803 RepID=A0A4Y2G0A5_ARAVE|nr:hypothetical protein AVEN_6044-1 [Araneus ventricosus]
MGNGCECCVVVMGNGCECCVVVMGNGCECCAVEMGNGCECCVVVMGNGCECCVVVMGNGCECCVVVMGNGCECCVVRHDAIFYESDYLLCSRSQLSLECPRIFLKGWHLEAPLVQGLGRNPNGHHQPLPDPFPRRYVLSLLEGPRAPRLLYPFRGRECQLTHPCTRGDPRRKQAEVNKTTPQNEVGDLNKEKPKRSCIPSRKSKVNSLQLERSEK